MVFQHFCSVSSIPSAVRNGFRAPLRPRHPRPRNLQPHLESKEASDVAGRGWGVGGLEGVEEVGALYLEFLFFFFFFLTLKKWVFG